MKKILLLYLLSFFTSVFSQKFNDYLPASFHKKQREILRCKMPKNSVAILFANPVKNRSGDVDYVYHQNTNFYYLTGFREPNAVVIIYTDNQTDATGNTYNEVIYVPKKDPDYEMWHGIQLGKRGVKKQLGFQVAKTSKEFITSKLNFKQFNHIFIEKFEDDYRNSEKNTAEIFDLVTFFKEKTAYNPSLFLSKPQQYIYKIIQDTPLENSTTILPVIRKAIMQFPNLKNDEIISEYESTQNNTIKKRLQKKVSEKLNISTPLNITFLPAVLAMMRETKSTEELKLLQKAINISVIGQIEVMKAIKPEMSEREVQSIHEFIYKKYGAEDEGYPGIVGSGNNGCILHYINNDKKHIGNNLVLMDLGAQYRGYSADITRTVPANGKFSPEQKAIYNLVLKAQNAGILACKVGNDFFKPGKEAKRIINEGLYTLGITKSINEKHNYFPHGSSHHIGLDVHDPSNYGKLKENMVITVEPGIYIPKGSSCNKKWWGIAIRIEDDILITNKTPKNLSKKAPRTVEAIEKMMAKKSVLNNWILPSLE